MYTEPQAPADPQPVMYRTHVKPAPGFKMDRRVRRALRQYRMAARANRAYTRRLAVHGYDGCLTADQRRQLRNLRKAGRV